MGEVEASQHTIHYAGNGKFIGIEVAPPVPEFTARSIVSGLQNDLGRRNTEVEWVKQDDGSSGFNIMANHGLDGINIAIAVKNIISPAGRIPIEMLERPRRA